MRERSSSLSSWAAISAGRKSRCHESQSIEAGLDQRISTTSIPDAFDFPAPERKPNLLAPLPPPPSQSSMTASHEESHGRHSSLRSGIECRPKSFVERSTTHSGLYFVPLTDDMADGTDMDTNPISASFEKA